MSVWFNENTYLRLYPKTKLFVIIRTGEKLSGYTPSGLSRGYAKHVIARGRMLDGRTMRVTRSEVSHKQIKEWLRVAGDYKIKIVGAKRR